MCEWRIGRREKRLPDCDYCFFLWLSDFRERVGPGALPEDEHDQDGGHGAAGQRQRAVQPVLPGLLTPPADAARRDRQPGKFGRALYLIIVIINNFELAKKLKKNFALSLRRRVQTAEEATTTRRTPAAA